VPSPTQMTIHTYIHTHTHTHTHTHNKYLLLHLISCSCARSHSNDYIHIHIYIHTHTQYVPSFASNFLFTCSVPLKCLYSCRWCAAMTRAEASTTGIPFETALYVSMYVCSCKFVSYVCMYVCEYVCMHAVAVLP
jgi:hypothetical protein